MEAVPRTIDYYKTDKGERPFTDWLDAQEVNVRARIMTRFKNVGQGNFGDHHAEGNGVWALIYDFGPGYRVYYGLTDDQKVVLLLMGGGKKRQNQDIQKAIGYWEDYKAWKAQEDKKKKK
jgi:putative addiction module killer protein